MKWQVVFNSYDHGSIGSIMNCLDVWGNPLDMENHIPRKGDYIASGDSSSNDKGTLYKELEDRKCYIVEDVFWNLRRKDIEVYLKEVDKETYPLF